MGSESSKPAEETPENWNHGNSFQVISPRSDISNPSDIHRIHRNRVPAPSTHPDRNRRLSKTITASIPKQESKLQRPSLAPPQALYFPTERGEDNKRLSDIPEDKENERPKRNLKNILKKTTKAMTGCFAESAGEMEMEQIEAEKAATFQQANVSHASKSRDAKYGGPRKSKSKDRRISDFDAAKEAAGISETMLEEDKNRRSGRQSNETTGGGRSYEKWEVKEETGIQDILATVENSFIVKESEGTIISHESFNKDKSAAIGPTQAALHHEEDYFARLTAGPSRYSDVHDSPMVMGPEAIRNLPSTLDNGAPLDNPDSPVSNLFLNGNEQTSPSVTNNEAPLGGQEDRSQAPSAMTGTSELVGGSVVHSLQKFHTQIRLNSGPEMYSDEEEKSVKVFFDQTHDSSYLGETKNAVDQSSLTNDNTIDQSVEERSERSGPSDAVLGLSAFAMGSKISDGVATTSDESATGEDNDDDSAVLSYFRPQEMNAVSAFRPRDVVPEEPLKQIAALGPNGRKEDNSKVSKLGSLFRPILPSLSVDDCATASSYDPYEIKVTESAPSVIESRDYRALALRPNYGSPASATSAKSRQLGAFSPSMMSIDSQVDQSPARTRVLVSDQALCNAEFLFSTEYNCAQKRLQDDRDSAMFSISTLGARSRMSQRSTRVEAVKIPVRNHLSSTSEDDDESRASSTTRRVRFSGSSASVSTAPGRRSAGIDMNVIESKMSDLTCSIGDSKSKKVENDLPEFKSQAEKFMAVDKSNGPETGIHWEYTTKDGVTAVTPHRKGKSGQNVTNSPYLRYQAAKSNYETAATKDITQDTIEIPAIETKVSDLTESLSDFGGRMSHGSVKSPTVEATIPEESELDDDSTGSSSQPKQLNWSYSEKDGVISAVTPHLKGRSLKNATNSPFLRFKNARNKFGTKDKESVPIKSSTSSRKRKSAARKPAVRKSGGAVSSRIDALNKKVRENRKLRRLSRRTSGNPRIHAPVETNVIRTRAIMTYKTDVVGIEKRNYMGAAKFNRIPDILDDDQSVDSSSSAGSFEDIQEDSREYQNAEPIREYLDVEDDPSELLEDKDDLSRMSEDAATVATVRQSRSPTRDSVSFSRPSEGGQSTSSHSFGNVRRQVFREYGSIGTQTRQSMASTGGSTTMSSILQKENSNHTFRSGKNAVKPSQQAFVTAPGALHLSPTQRTPMEARKWRSLAAAAKEKDAMKRTGGGLRLRARKGLAERNANIHPGTGATFAM